MRQYPDFIWAGLSRRQNHAELIGQLLQRNGVVYDANGPRIVQFVSDFPALRIHFDNPSETYRTIDAIVRAGRHGARIFYGLAESEEDYGGYWKGAMVNPYTHTMETLIPVMRLYRNAGLKVHLSGGYKFARGWSEEISFLTWMITTIAREKLHDTVGLFEWRNEFQITSPYGGDSPETYQYGDMACKLASSILGCLTTLGSPGEDDPAIKRTLQGVETIAGIDGERGMSGDLIMKHAHRFYYDGRYKGYYRDPEGDQAALWVLEPTGPDGVNGDVYLPEDTPAYVYGLHMTYALTGQAVSYFSGPAVRHKRPLDTTWGWYELPKLVKFFPEDIGTYTGPTWFVKNNGKRFYSVVAEAWNLLGQLDTQVKTWEVQYHDGVIEAGSGPIRLQRKDWRACAVRGELR